VIQSIVNTEADDPAAIVLAATAVAISAIIAEMFASGPAIVKGDELRTATIKPMTVALMSALVIPSCRYPAQLPEKISVAYEMLAMTVMRPEMQPAKRLFILSTVSRSPFPVHRFPFIVSRSSFPVHRFPFIVSRSSFPVHRFPFIVPLQG
jgi:hypothetical protein